MGWSWTTLPGREWTGRSRRGSLPFWVGNFGQEVRGCQGAATKALRARRCTGWANIICHPEYVTAGFDGQAWCEVGVKSEWVRTLQFWFHWSPDTSTVISLFVRQWALLQAWLFRELNRESQVPLVIAHVSRSQRRRSSSLEAQFIDESVYCCNKGHKYPSILILRREGETRKEKQTRKLRTEQSREGKEEARTNKTRWEEDEKGSKPKSWIREYEERGPAVWQLATWPY